MGSLRSEERGEEGAGERERKEEEREREDCRRGRERKESSVRSERWSGSVIGKGILCKRGIKEGV